jgi:hypothetical protein
VHCFVPFLMLSSPGHITTRQHRPAAISTAALLNTDTWAQVLLPKLVEQGSAAAVALTCSQMRDLCYSSRQSINLGALLDSSEPWNLRSLVQRLPLHFPNCSTVSVELNSVLCYQNMPFLLPALARWVS